MKGLLLLALLLAVACLASAQGQTVPPGEYTIAKLQINGLRGTDESSVVALLSGLAEGKRVRLPGDVSKAITKLWKQDIFSDVRVSVTAVEGEQVSLLINLTERPRITRYDIRGIRKGQANDLKEKIKLIRGTIFTEAKSRSAVRAIRNFFQEKGYLEVKVDIETKPDTFERRNGVRVIFRVAKGPKVKIKHIYFEGNKLLSAKTLKAKLKETKEQRFYRFWKRSRFVRGKFTEDKDKLAEFFGKEGLRDAQILSDTFVQVSSKHVVLTIKMYEGPRYYFRNITWNGNYKYDNTILTRVLGIKKGDVYDTELLHKKLSMDPGNLDVSSLYLDDGYLFFRADPVEIAAENDSIDLEIRIFEGPQATIHKIIVEGNDKTNERVILREVRTLPGEKFSRSDLIRSQREIVNLGYFDQQKMNVVPIPHPENGTVDIKYVVAEKSNDQITLQGGWGGQIRDARGNIISGGLTATVGLQFNNFSTRHIFDSRFWKPLPSGDGQKLSLQVQSNGVNFQNYGISFLEPWFGGRKPNSLGVNMNYSVQKSPTINGGYFVKYFSTSVDFGRRLHFPDDFFNSYTTLRYANYNTRNAANLFANFGNGTGTINLLSLRQTISRSSIDAPIFSRSGSSITFSAEATPPWHILTGQSHLGESAPQDRFKLLEFYKVKFDSQVYLPITETKRPLVLFTRARLGLLGAYDTKIGISPFERFYLGGSGLQGYSLDGREIIALRGYESANIGPALGAASFVKYTMELRQAVALEQSATVWVHVFMEAGNAWNTIQEFNPFEFKRSFGGGARFFLPMFGLLGLDYGYGVDPVFYQGADISKGHFHFLIGQQF